MESALTTTTPKRVVQVPIRDSKDSERLKSTLRLCTEVWNLTQQWFEHSTSATSALYRISNNRLRLIYARGLVVEASTSQTASAGSISQADQEIERAKSKLSLQEQFEISKELVRDYDSLECSLNEMQAFKRKFDAVCSRFSSMKALNQNDSRALALTEELADVFPRLATALVNETGKKKKDVVQFGLFEHRSVFERILSEWEADAGVDRGLLERLYALIADGSTTS